LANIVNDVCKGDVFSDTTAPENINNQYSKPGEEATLANALSDIYTKQFGGIKISPSNICTTVGAQEGIFTSLAAFCNPGDEIVMITPSFDAYFKSAAVLGLTVKSVPLSLPTFSGSDNSISAGL
jgi:aspartate/methionine/tyrosine aminotransferase